MTKMARNARTCFLFAVLLVFGCSIRICVGQASDSQNTTTTTTCPVPSPPPDDRVDDPVCSLCPDGMVLDPTMADMAPQQEYASQIATVLAQAGQQELIPLVLSYVTCGCEQLEYLFSSELLNSLINGMDGIDETCSMLQTFLGSGDFPGGPQGCCMPPKDDTATSSASGHRCFIRKNGTTWLLLGGVLTLVMGYLGILL